MPIYYHAGKWECQQKEEDCHERLTVLPSGIGLKVSGSHEVRVYISCYSIIPFAKLEKVMAGRLTTVLLLLLTVAAVAHGGRRRVEEMMAVSDRLQKVNKQPVKSIHSPDGDIIDCVRLEHQPAFDRPEMKDHVIQTRPSYHPEGGRPPATHDAGSLPLQLWHVNGGCPEETIPIRRTKDADILRAKKVETFGKKTMNSYPRPQSVNPVSSTTNGHQHAIVYVEGGKYYGAKGTINVWQPETEQPNEFSLSQIWVLGGTFDKDLNSIEAGWQVSPDLYGDNKTRLFTYWTSDAYQATGCYNLLCSGFVQINNQIAIGGSIYPVSTLKGSQYEITLLIWKDPKEGNWWLQFGNKYVLGYWPGFLFSNLADGASLVEWGGEVVNSQTDGQHTTTEMGSGHFPEDGYGLSAYFKNIQVVDAANVYRPPDGLTIFAEQPNCYNARQDSSRDWGNFFFYGGPGRNPKCV